MLEPVYLGRGSVDDHRAPAGDDGGRGAAAPGRPLRGLRVLHLSATPYGGGVAEILRSEIPLLRDLGLVAEWRLIRGDERFFEVTKSIHNGLQGADHPLTGEERDEYLGHSEHSAAELGDGYDVIVAHDPQPLPLRSYHGADDARWIWRCHIDTSAPNKAVWEFLRDYVAAYDAAVFTAEAFVPPDIPPLRGAHHPAGHRSSEPQEHAARPHAWRGGVLSWLGLDVELPLMAQVSRFDRWKDPFGVLDAYRLARRDVPDLQLAMVGSMALDDPEAWDIHRRLQLEAHGDPQVHLFTNLVGVGNIEVNAVQRLAGVVVQKSIREGFGLVVSEALWKGTPVVATHAGGIPLQMASGEGGFLVDSTAECAERVVWLLRHRDEARRIGARGHDRVRARYLLTRLLADDLRLYAELPVGADARRP